MDVHQRTTHGQTPAARVGAIIHDYAAYARKDQRRTDDKRVRAHIALRLSAAVRELLAFRAAHEERLNGTGDEFNLALRRLRNAIDAVTDIPPGYSGFFDAEQVRAADTDRLVEADLALIERARGLVEMIGGLTRAALKDAALRAECAALARNVTDLARALESRTELFAS